MATRGEIEGEVQRIVTRRIGDIDAAIPTFIDRAQSEIEDTCAFPEQEAVVEYQVVSTTIYYPHPTDFVAVRERPRYLRRDDSDSTVFLLEVRDFDELGRSLNPDAPKYWREEAGTSFEFWPRGDDEGPSQTTSGAYDVRIPYWKRLPTLDEPDSVNFWSLRMDDVLVYATAAHMFAELRDPIANFWSARAEARFQKIVKQTKYARIRQRDFRLWPTQNMSGRANHGTRYGGRRVIVARVPNT